MIDIQQLTSLISAFRVETEKESISPETVGSISLLSSVMYQLTKRKKEDETGTSSVSASSASFPDSLSD